MRDASEILIFKSFNALNFCHKHDLICIVLLFCFQAKRYAEFMDLKRQIILYMEELDHAPETSFEKDVVCEDEDSFCLSRDNITSLKLLVCQVRFIYVLIYVLIHLFIQVISHKFQTGLESLRRRYRLNLNLLDGRVEESQFHQPSW